MLIKSNFSVLFFLLSLIFVRAQDIKLEEYPLDFHQARIAFSHHEFFTLQIDNKLDIKKIESFHFLGGKWIAMRWKDIQSQGLFSSKSIVRYGKLKPESKLSNILSFDSEIENQYKSHQAISFQVHTWGSHSETEKELKSIGVESIKWNDYGNIVTIIANDRQVEQLAETDFISYIEPVSERRTPLLNTMRAFLNIDAVHSESPLGLNFKGENIKLGIWDYGIAGFHKDLEGQIVNLDRNFYGASASQHSTLSSGAMLSKGVLRTENIGAAPKAKGYLYDFFGPILDEIKSVNENYGVFATNHSYNLGDAYRCFYDYRYSTASAEIDQFAIDNKRIVNVFAAGNSARACAYDYKTIVPGFQYAKNVILVGNLQTNETFYPGSAKGPTNDGRLAPHVMAKGSESFTPTKGITLPTPVDGYASGYGTSFAAPIVTGVVGLMQEAYLKNHAQMPLNATIKAILCNTAKDIGVPGPDYDYGFGKIDAYQAVKSILEENYIEDTVVDDEEKTFTIQVPEGTRELKVLLTWNDLPASLPNDKILVNDLDLELISPERAYLPLVLNPKKPDEKAIERRDSLNNIEQVVILNPVAGTYTIKVKGYQIVSTRQDFSVSYWMNLDEFRWNYPLKDNVLTAGAKNILRWRSKTEADEIQIDYALDGGNEWMSIGTQLPDSNYFVWNTPEGHHTKVLLRATKNNGQVLSVTDSFFISPLITLKASNCYGHIKTSWDDVEADSYIISILNNDNDWEDVVSTSANSYTFDNLKLGEEYYFSVRPFFDNWEGKRSYAVKLTYANTAVCSLDEKLIGVTDILPQMGAVGTEYALTDEEHLEFTINNFSALAIPNVKLFYKVGDDEIKEVAIGNLAKNKVLSYVTDEIYDFSQLGIYQVKAWLSSTDEETHSDTLTHYIYQKQSLVADFPYSQDFEAMDDTLLYTQTFVGIKEMPEWDYVKTGTGRIFNSLSASYSPEGDRALSIDSYINKGNAKNTLYLNIDLSNQQDSLVYLDYKFIQRSGNLAGDSIYLQGSQTDEWIPLKNIYYPSLVAGRIYQAKRINLSESIAGTTQNFSNHSVLKFVFSTPNNTATTVGNGGYTIDDIQLYNGGVDLSIESIDVNDVYCLDASAMPLEIPVKVLVKNNSPHLISAGEMYFSLIKNGDVISDEINKNDILPFGEIEYTFTKKLEVDSYESFEVSVHLEHADDFISENNDSKTRTVSFVHQIKQLPLELSFNDTDEIQFVPAGNTYSWEVGQPQKNYIYNVADNPGSAYVTDLKRYYLSNEESYLNIGCLDPDLLTSNSEMSFLLIYNTENGVDGMWAEYSYDGNNWSDLGNHEAGYNWYVEDTYNAWDGDMLNWQVASLPLSELVGGEQEQVFFRFGFASDEYIQMEGIGIDNFRINNAMHARIATESTQVTGLSTGDGLVELKSDDVIYGYLDDKGQVLGTIVLDILVSEDEILSYRDKFLMSRYFHIQTDNKPERAYNLTLFSKNSEYLEVLNHDRNIRRMGEIGYLVYDGVNTDTAYSNNHFSDNYTFYHPDSIAFWPYIDGYELRFSLDKQEAEIYLSSNEQSLAAYPKLTSIIDLKVYRDEDADVSVVEWETEADLDVKNYTVQHSLDAINFEDVISILKSETNTYSFLDEENNENGEHYYRVVASNETDAYTSLLDSVLINRKPTAIKDKHSENWMMSYMGKGNLWFSTNQLQLSSPHYRLIDISGRIIDEWTENDFSGNGIYFSKNLHSAPAAMYILQIKDGEIITSSKFVKSD